MHLNRSLVIVTVLYLSLFAPGANAQENMDAAGRGRVTASTESAGLNRALAEKANAAAAEEAILAVRAAVKRNLDIRIINRTSVQTRETTVEGR